ncbi:hypothetical protein AZA_89177 [Nitrospirillum viridazoti Y2]|nr:hypothetical protein AZA_89177 [Nitrospirillum amazonense Y2]
MGQPVGAIADGELDAEVHPQAHEQHGEGDGQQVEGAGGDQAEGGGGGKADDHRQQNGAHHAEGLHRQPQQHQHGDARQAAVEGRPFAQGAELLVRHGHLARQADPDAVLGRQAQILGGGADSVGRHGARLQVVEVQHWLHQDETAQFHRVGRLPGHQAAPVQGHHLALGRRLQCAGQRVEGALKILQLGLAVADALQVGAQRVKEAARRRVGRQRAQQRLRLDQRLHGGLHLFRGQQHQAFAVEIGAAIGAEDVAHHVGTLTQGVGQHAGGALRQFRRHAIHDDGGLLHLLGIQLVEGDLALAPDQLRRQQLHGVGVDGEVGGDMEGGRRPQHQAGQQGQLPAPAAGGYQRGHPVVKAHFSVGARHVRFLASYVKTGAGLPAPVPRSSTPRP